MGVERYPRDHEGSQTEGTLSQRFKRPSESERANSLWCGSARVIQNKDRRM